MTNKEHDEVLIKGYIDIIETYSEDIMVVDAEIIQNYSISEGVEVGNSQNVSQFVREKYFEKSTDLLKVLASTMEETDRLENYVEEEIGGDPPVDEQQRYMENTYGREYYQNGSFETKYATAYFTISHPFGEVDFQFILNSEV